MMGNKLDIAKLLEQKELLVEILSEWHSNALEKLIKVTAERDSLAAQLAELKRQEPAYWIAAGIFCDKERDMAEQKALGVLGSAMPAIPLYTKPVALAQLVVPNEVIPRLRNLPGYKERPLEYCENVGWNNAITEVRKRIREIAAALQPVAQEAE